MGAVDRWSVGGLCVIAVAAVVATALILGRGSSIYDRSHAPAPLLEYLSSDSHLTIEDINDRFREPERTIASELDNLIGDNYVTRDFENGLYYYRLTEWGAVYMNYLEGRE